MLEDYLSQHSDLTEGTEARGMPEVPALADFPHNIRQKPKTQRGEGTQSYSQ